MIQRIQSLFLLAIGILMVANLFVSFWSAQGIEKQTGISGTIQANPVGLHFVVDGQSSVQNKKDLYYIGALSLLVGLNALFILIQFRNRKLQMRLSALNYLLLSGIMALYFLAVDSAKTIFECADVSYRIGFYIPLLSIVLNYFALRYIRKDEELIKSVDRIR